MDRRKKDGMRAAVLAAPHQHLSVVERDVPQPGPGEVLIRVRACGVCYGDFNLQQGHYPFTVYPTVPGHEVAGIVESVGDGVAWPAVGDRVGVPFLFSSCGYCAYCIRGDQILCAKKRVTGISADGGYQEFMVALARHVAPIPDLLDFDVAAPLMCAGLTVFNGLRRAGYQPGQKVAIIGFGGLGHLAVRFAVAMGARVAVLTRSREVEAQARESGAERLIVSKESEPGASLAAWDGGPEFIVNTAPATSAGLEALPGLAPDGTLLLLGYGGDLAGSPAGLIMGRRRIMGSPSGSPHDLRDTLEFAATHNIVPDVHAITLEEADDAVQALGKGGQRGRAVIGFH